MRYTFDVWNAVRRSDPDYDTLEKWISVTTGRDRVRRAIFERTVAGGSRYDTIVASNFRSELAEFALRTGSDFDAVRLGKYLFSR